jgi:hypothetical protein
MARGSERNQANTSRKGLSMGQSAVHGYAYVYVLGLRGHGRARNMARFEESLSCIF